MTKQDDANLNTSNPLTLRSAIYGRPRGKSHEPKYQDIDDNFLNLMRWGGLYDPASPRLHLKNEVVRDEDWLMIANKDTNDRPGPMPTGDPTWVADLGGTVPDPMPIQTNANSLWITGQKYSFQDFVQVTGYRWYAPDDSGNFTYEIWAEIEGDALLQVSAPVAPSTVGWFTVPANKIYIPGDVLNLYLVGRSVVQPNQFTATWQVENKDGDPDSEKATFQNNATEIRIHKTPKSGDASQLPNVQVGAELSFAGSIWTVTAVSDNGSHMRFTLSPNQGRPGEDDRAITFKWGSSAPIPYAVQANHFSALATVDGMEGSSYPIGATNDNMYGIDILADYMTYSPDWDLMGYSTF